jgi:3'-phosphoadenosine 5'-phosphosulfate sulfotransferase (PAPS reductase)/FAD synthetase
MAQFCTEFLKTRAIDDACVIPALERGSLVQWLGVRRDESLNRRNVPMFRRIPQFGHPRRVSITLFCPIIHWTAKNVISFSQAHGLRPNPLYMHGMGRVGCFPCINASKGELRQIGLRFPDAVERIAAWERIVAAASKRGNATFFAPSVTPEGSATEWPDAAQVFEWAKTTRGGRQFDLFAAGDDGLSCSSQYGLCE